MAETIDKLSSKLTVLGFPVVSSSWGSDDVQNHQPYIVVGTESLEEKDLLKSKMAALLKEFYSNRAAHNQIRIVDISGQGANGYMPKFGFQILSGQADNMEGDTGISDFDFYNEDHLRALRDVLNKYRNEMQDFLLFLDQKII